MVYGYSPFPHNSKLDLESEMMRGSSIINPEWVVEEYWCANAPMWPNVMVVPPGTNK
jgi:hypothetical protein